MVKILGFTLLRNAVKYDYCFQESLSSLRPLVSYTVVALGKGEDETEQIVAQLPDIKLLHTVWDESLRHSGLILSQQTNAALAYLRDEEIRASAMLSTNAWAIYLQADEVLHENDYERIVKDIELADEHGFDAVAFRYKHFWLHHNQLTVGKKWYPQEVRAIKLHSAIQSTGDAQGFEGCQKIYPSEAFIYHYGHVREWQTYSLKKADFHKLYHTDADLKKAQLKEEKKYNKGRFLPYFASHPAVMEQRILRFGDAFKPNIRSEIWIKASESDFSEAFTLKIMAEKIHWISAVAQCPSKWRKTGLIIYQPNVWNQLLYPSRVKNRPDSNLGADWPAEYILTLKLAEKNIGVN